MPKLVSGIALALCLLLPTACDRGGAPFGEVRQLNKIGSFNDKLVDTLTESDERFPPFTAFLDQYAEGWEVDVERMRAMQAELAKSVRSDLDRVTEMTVPDDELCKAFHGACLEYVQNSCEITEKYNEVIDYIAKNNPGKEDNAVAHKSTTAADGSETGEPLTLAGDAEEEATSAQAENEASDATAIEAPKWRTWTSADGKYSVEAKFVHCIGRPLSSTDHRISRTLTLVMRDGTRVEVQLDVLCSEDQDYVKKRKWAE
ncbi:MAG: SHD1 domain-containing protein [Planctomycetota bacterium]|jgi:hypothetical protein